MTRNAKKLSEIVEKQKTGNARQISLTINEAALMGMSESENSESPHVNLKWFWPKHECFSDWGKADLKAFSEFCRKITQTKWPEIYRTGGHVGNKGGFGYTKHSDTDKLPTNPELEKFSSDLTWFELRITNKARVHGFRVKSAFFLVFLDKDHKVYKS